MSTRELDDFYFPCSCCSGFATIEPTLPEPFHSQDLNMNNSLCHSPYAPYNSSSDNLCEIKQYLLIDDFFPLVAFLFEYL